MLKNSKLFYFCYLKKLVRPETFGPYYVAVDMSSILLKWILKDEEVKN